MATIPASENEFPQLLFAEGAAASTPAAGLVVCYAKSDGLIYCKDDAGTETAYGALPAHLADTSDAHDASAISILDSGAHFTATDVEAALAELFAAIGAGGIPATIIDAKGDLIAGTAADTAARLAVGTDTFVLTAASGQSTGLQWIAPAGRLLAVTYDVTGGNKSTTSTTAADVDATNAIIAFTAPASGNVLVRVTCVGNMSAANQNAFLGLRESTTNLVNSGGTPAGTFAMQGNATFGLEVLITWAAYLTGVSAGAHTYKLSFGVNGGATFTLRQAANQPIVLEVWAV